MLSLSLTHSLMLHQISYTARTTCLGLVPPEVGQALLHQMIRQPPTDIPTGQSDLGNSSAEVFLSDDSKLCQGDS